MRSRPAVSGALVVVNPVHHFCVPPLLPMLPIMRIIMNIITLHATAVKLERPLVEPAARSCVHRAGG
jgi:hypothetical protein